MLLLTTRGGSRYRKLPEGTITPLRQAQNRLIVLMYWQFPLAAFPTPRQNDIRSAAESPAFDTRR